MERLWAFTSLEREKTWERHLTRFQHLELMSYLSRLWNFNQTGDLRVIPYKAFKALGAYKSFLKTNWLSFRDIASFDTQPSSDRPMLSLSPTRIPVDEKSGELILSADSSLAYHYNDEMAQVRFCYSFRLSALTSYCSSIARTSKFAYRPSDCRPIGNHTGLHLSASFTDLYT